MRDKLTPSLKTRIGHLLVRADLVTEAQLSRALEVQNFAGGRIGTLLLERAALGEDDLGKTLALQQGCGYVPWNALAALPPETLAVLPARLALKHNAVPYECGEGYVRMALRDPNDLRALDELVFVTGRKVFAGVAPEARIYQALEKYYGKLRTPRYAILAEKLSRLSKVAPPGASSPSPAPGFFAQTGEAPATTGPSPAPAAETTPSAVREFPASSPAERPARPPGTSSGFPPAVWSPFIAPPPEPERSGEPEEIPWEDTTGSRSRSKGESSSPPPAPVGDSEDSDAAVFETEREEPPAEPFPPSAGPGFARVLAATERDSIADAVLASLVPRFPVAAVFSSRSSGVTGWAAVGTGADTPAIRSFSVSWTEPSVFLNARLAHGYYMGPLPSLRCHQRLAAALGGWPEECLVQAVFLGQRPVAFLYVSSPSSGAFSTSDMTFVQGLSEVASKALANAIRLKKGEI